VNRSALLRLGIGVLISVVFLAATLSQVNLAKVAATITDASPAWLLVAFGIVVVDLGLRALRWQVLLRGIPGAERKAPYNLVVGYLMIGFTLNAILPARLGDIARAILAGNGFLIARLAVFGTILIERFSDGLTMLGLALLSSVIVAAGIAGLIALGIFLAIITRPRVRATRIGALVFGFIGRIAVGGGALTTLRGASTVLLLTAACTTTAILVAWAVSNAVGLDLAPIEVVLFLSGIALSLAIPAAPGALGTYEFVGTAIVTSLGYPAELGLATILLMRFITVFPPAIAGLVSLFVLDVRPGDIMHAAETPDEVATGAGPAPAR
jgi:uncharacterized membrane protein YbhN (UPF0104 family)